MPDNLFLQLEIRSWFSYLLTPQTQPWDLEPFSGTIPASYWPSQEEISLLFGAGLDMDVGSGVTGCIPHGAAGVTLWWIWLQNLLCGRSSTGPRMDRAYCVLNHIWKTNCNVRFHILRRGLQHIWNIPLLYMPVTFTHGAGCISARQCVNSKQRSKIVQ